MFGARTSRLKRRTLGGHVELFAATGSRCASDRDRRRDETIRVARILVVLHHVHARLGVELDERRRVRDGKETIIFRIERKVIQSLRRFLLVVHVVAVGDRARMWRDEAGLGAANVIPPGSIGSRRRCRAFFRLQFVDFFLHVLHVLLHRLHVGFELVEFALTGPAP